MIDMKEALVQKEPWQVLSRRAFPNGERFLVRYHGAGREFCAGQAVGNEGDGLIAAHDVKSLQVPTGSLSGSGKDVAVVIRVHQKGGRLVLDVRDAGRADSFPF